MDSATTAAPSEPALPVPVIVVLAVGGYLVLIVLLVVIRQFLVARGVCMACAPCGKEDGSLQCCDCWISCAEGCNCCAYPNVKSCLDSVCGPPDNRCSMTKCVSCQTCQNNTCCGDEASGFESCCGTGDSCSNQGCESCCSWGSPSTSCCGDPDSPCCGNNNNSCSCSHCESCCSCGSPSTSCCGDPNSKCCGNNNSCSCAHCECAGCDCACQAPECDTIDCFCFKVNMHN